MRNWVRQIHMVGIGGSGMRGIAEVLLNLGYGVSGSDLKPGGATLRLADLGARIYSGHEAANVRGADVVVISSAVPEENPEVQAARAMRIPVIRRAEMLAELMRFKQGIAIAGRAAFVQFLQRLPFYGLAVLCTDDPQVAGLISELRTPVLRYGFGEGVDLQARDVVVRGIGAHFSLWRLVDGDYVHWMDVDLGIPGRHNVLNAMAAIGIASKVGVPEAVIRQALADFRGVGRRFEVLGDFAGVTVVDDYGHHPREIAATIAAARAVWPERPLVLAFQPHRYTRTQALFGDFVATLAAADQVVLTEIYGAGEKPLPGITGRALAEALTVQGTRCSYAPDLLERPQQILADLPANAVLLTMGAGSIATLAGRWPAVFAEERP